MKKIFQITVTAFLSVILCVLFAGCDFDFDFSDDGPMTIKRPAILPRLRYIISAILP